MTVFIFMNYILNSKSNLFSLCIMHFRLWRHVFIVIKWVILCKCRFIVYKSICLCAIELHFFPDVDEITVSIFIIFYFKLFFSMSFYHIVSYASSPCLWFLQPISEPVSRPEGKQAITLVPGDGVGPELCASVKEVFRSTGVPIEFEEIFVRYIKSLMFLMDKYLNFEVGLKCILMVFPYLLLCSYINENMM